MATHKRVFDSGKVAAGIAIAILCGALRPCPSMASQVAPPILNAPLDLDHMVAGRLDEARTAILESLQDPGRWLDFGKVLHAHDLTEPAAECYAQAVELAPADPKARYFLALARYDLGEPALALESLDEAARLDVAYAPVYWHRGRWLAEQGRDEEAEAAFQRAVEVDPQAQAGWVGLARIYLERGDPAQAIEILNKVLSVDQANGVAGQLLGRALREVGDEELARRVLAMSAGMGADFPDPWRDEILSSSTGVGNLLRLLSAQLERGDLEGATTELERLRQEHPDDVGVLNKLSEAYLHRGDPSSALEVLQRALEVDPEDFSTLVHIAQAKRMEGDLRTALDWIDRAVRANPRYWQVHFERAAILYNAGQYPQTLEALDDALAVGAHQNPSAWLMKGECLLQLGEWDEAATTLEQTIYRFPFLGQAFIGLALARAEQGRLEDARIALSRAEPLMGPDPTLDSVAARIQELEAAAGGEP